MIAKNGLNGIAGNLPLIIAVIVMLLGIFGGFWSVADPRGAIQKLEDKQGLYMSLREFEAYKQGIRRELEATNTALIQFNVLMTASSHGLAQLNELDKRMEAQSRRLSDIQNAFGSTFSPGEKLRELQRQIEILQERSARSSWGGASNNPR